MIRSKWTGHYGYFEAIVKVPNQPGAWTAFWLYPADMNGAGEIDIFEIVQNQSGSENTRRSYHYLHPGRNDTECPHPAAKFTGPNTNETYRAYAPGFDFAAGFHKFAAIWEPGRLRHYVDDVLVFDTPFHWPQTKDVSDCRFAPAATIMLNYNVGGTWPGDPVAASLPSNLIVKRVQVWQK
jgi:beta-glucanase (GH16 family)